MSVNVGNLVAHLDLDTKGFYAGLMGAQNAMASASNSMKAMGRALSLAITAPLLAAGGAAVNAAVSFETAFARMQGLAGVAAEDIAGLREEVLKLSKETGRGPQELAEALQFIESSGYKGAKAVEILTISANAARAGMGQTRTVADLLTSAMEAYGTSNLDATSAMNSLVAAIRLGKAEPEGFAANLGYIIPIAAEMGSTFNDTVAMIGAMSRKMSATDVSTAITNLRQVFSDLLSPAKGAKDALKEWGTSASEVRKIIKDDGLITALEFVKKKMDAFGSEEGFAEIFGNVRSLTGTLSLVGVSATTVKEVMADMTDNTNEFNYAVEVAANTTQDKFNRALASLKVSGIELGNALIPIFLDLVDGIKAVANWFTGLTDEGKKMVLAIGGILIIAGPLLSFFGTLGTLIGALFTPMGAVVGAILAIGAAFIYVYENWEAFKERLSDWSWWKNLFIDMGSAAITKFGDVIDFLGRAWYTLKDNINIALNELIVGWNTFASALKLPTLQLMDQAEYKQFTFELSKSLEEARGEQKKYEHEFKGGVQSMVDFAKKAGKAIGDYLFPNGVSGAPSALMTKGPAGSTALQGTTEKPNTSYASAIQAMRKKQHEEFMAQTSNEQSAYAGMINMTNLLNDAMVNLAGAGLNMVAEGFEQVAKGQLDAGQIGMAMLSSLANFGIQLGKQMVMIAIATETFKKTIWAYPVAAIAGGIALIAGLSLLKGTIAKNIGRGGNVQGLATGGSVTDGGVFQLHKNEMVSLPKGSAVTPAHMTTGMSNGRGGGGNLTTQISLRKLIIELDKERTRMGR